MFAPFDPRDRDLARQRLGDLLLEAVHHSAITTACDALGAGLPVLVAADLDALVKAAAVLGNDPAALGGVKAKREANRATAPLFDTTAHMRQLEAAFVEMYRHHRAGVPPASFRP